MKRVAILGSTGSIGTQTLEVIRQNPDRFKVTALTCGSNTELLAEQIEEFRPEFASAEREEDAARLAAIFPDVEFGWGRQGLIDAACGSCDTDFKKFNQESRVLRTLELCRGTIRRLIKT